MKRLTFAIFTLTLSIFTAAPAMAATYKVDPDHTSVSFKIKHLFSKVQGSFKKYEGTIDYDQAQLDQTKAAGSIDVKSLDTGSPDRDKHLLSPDFFDADKYPTITFKTTAAKIGADGKGTVEGLLTIKGKEKPVTLDASVNGIGADPWGNTRAAFSAKTKINRSEFGIDWNQPLNAGGFLLGEEVEIDLEIEGILQK